VGTAATLTPEVLGRPWQPVADAPADPDLRNQSYVIELWPRPDGESQTTIVIASLGADDTPRASLGLGYGLAAMLRYLDLREGRWGFCLPAERIVCMPAIATRTVYQNVSPWRLPGVGIEGYSPEQLREYVDFLVDAGYSRVSFWQGSQSLDPGISEADRPAVEAMHRQVRALLGYARRRGLEVYHQLTPAYVDQTLLPEAEKYRGVGWYTEKPGHGGLCWHHPEVQALCRRVAREMMEYYGPVDGYTVWFYDPAGCFCDWCRPNQAQALYEQLSLVADLAQTIGPGARMQAVLWPTWIFPQYEDEGIPYNKEQTDAFVSDFLTRCLERFGPRGLSIVDSCEIPTSNVYNGLAKPEQFQRTGFVYSVLGLAGEAGYIFPPYRFRGQAVILNKAQEEGLDEVMIYTHHAPLEKPALYALAATAAEPQAAAEQIIRRYAATVAKGEAQQTFVEMLTALEDLDEATGYDGKEQALVRVETLWERLKPDAHFHADRSWLQGYVRAQRYYLDLARAKDSITFRDIFDRFIAEVGAIPMYHEYVTRSISPELCVNAHLATYWRGPAGDRSKVGLYEEEKR